MKNKSAGLAIPKLDLSRLKRDTDLEEEEQLQSEEVIVINEKQSFIDEESDTLEIKEKDL